MSDPVAVVRAVVGALVGGFLIVYAAVAAPPNRVVIAVVGLLLLGAITVDTALLRRKAE